MERVEDRLDYGDSRVERVEDRLDSVGFKDSGAGQARTESRGGEERA